MNDKWPKYRIQGAEGLYRVQVAYSHTRNWWGGKGDPNWLTPFGIPFFKTVEEAESWALAHKARNDPEKSIVKIIE